MPIKCVKCKRKIDIQKDKWYLDELTDPRHEKCSTAWIDYYNDNPGQFVMIHDLGIGGGANRILREGDPKQPRCYHLCPMCGERWSHDAYFTTIRDGVCQHHVIFPDLGCFEELSKEEKMEVRETGKVMRVETDPHRW